MTNRMIGLVAAITAAVALLCTAAPAVLLGGIASACTAPATASGTSAVQRWGADQVANAATIVAVGAQRGVPPRGWVIAVATAMQESGLRNLPNGDRDSVGLFQQRPSQGWGTIDQLQVPAYAAGKFYERLLTIPAWHTMTLTYAAQAVQRSAFPDAYAKWEDDATALVQQLAAAPGTVPPGDVEWCLHAGAWTQPVNAPIVSGFRTPERPDHDGVDLGAPAETHIRAAATGEVITAQCDTDPSGQLCNRRGSPSTPGCGWYVKIRHANNLVTMYCHMIRQPIVRVGQVVAVGQEIGQVGSSGHSSGDHLHFETQHPDRGPIDPVSYMRDHGAPLGQP